VYTGDGDNFYLKVH